MQLSAPPAAVGAVGSGHQAAHCHSPLHINFQEINDINEVSISRATGGDMGVHAESHMTEAEIRENEIRLRGDRRGQEPSERNFAREETLRKPVNLEHSACVYLGSGPSSSVPSQEASPHSN
ncbi:hypothetical protein EYF80_008923 [Liparis tanakae]|uniref:Uncharacterized protein n=1 Tax=Liparis tanakae TaxID=230148 RepID=A0A4Z2ITK1_9TELE|nr:hypothetical protein EYF80_008923 [Liparis tanakae]